MKKIIRIIATVILLSQLSITSFAYNYTFTSGPDSKTTFDKSTQTDAIPAQNPLSENIRRNKDAAYNPPPYGIFSGDIPTDPSSPYHTQDNSTVVSASSQGVTYSDYASGGGEMPPAFNHTDEILPSTSVYGGEPAQILPLYYSDGSIGTLEFPRFNRTIKVYEGESMENMRLGAAHVSSTSTWDGNCVVAAHNRGVPNNFSFVKDMNTGDKIVYTTQYGVRTYEVITKKQIKETDTSGLAWSADNILSIYTCLENKPGYRWYVVAKATGN